MVPAAACIIRVPRAVSCDRRTMPLSPSEDVTGLLIDWSNGDQTAYERLVPLVYAELHRLSHRYMGRERSDHTLQTTALVNEAYVRLVDQRRRSGRIARSSSGFAPS